jgi:hypothetical protein
MRIIAILLTYFIAHPALADEVNEHVALNCSGGTANIITGFINHSPTQANAWPPNDFILAPLTCNISKDREVVFVVTEGKQSLRGACGLNPQQTISVQINGVTIFTESLSPKCGGLLIKSILVSGNNIKVCKYSEVSYAAPWIDISEPSYVCTEMPLNMTN